MDGIESQLRFLEANYPLSPHTRAGRLITTVRRMKAERELKLPVRYRTGFPISVETGHTANAMDEAEWERFYQRLVDELRSDYPDAYERTFSQTSPD